MIVRENIILALGQLILDWESGLPTGSGHRSRGLTTSHIWDCQKLPQKSPPRGPVGIAGEERAVQSGAAAGAPPGWGPLTLPAGQGGAPGPSPSPQLPARTFPSITGLLQRQPTQGQGCLHRREEQSRRTRSSGPGRPLSVRPALPGASPATREPEELPFTGHRQSHHNEVPAAGPDPLRRAPAPS